MGEAKPARKREPKKSSRAGTPARDTIDFDRYVPSVLSRFVDLLRRGSYRYLYEQFGLTMPEWRLLAELAATKGASAYGLARTTGLDKASVSRSVAALAARKLVRVVPEQDSARGRMLVTLTDAGRILDLDAREEIVKRHARLVAGLSEDTIECLLDAVRHLERRLPFMSKEDAPRHPSYSLFRKRPRRRKAEGGK